MSFRPQHLLLFSMLCVYSSPQVRSERFMFSAANDSLPHSQLAHQEGTCRHLITLCVCHCVFVCLSA